MVLNQNRKSKFRENSELPFVLVDTCMYNEKKMASTKIFIFFWSLKLNKFGKFTTKQEKIIEN